MNNEHDEPQPMKQKERGFYPVLIVFLGLLIGSVCIFFSFPIIGGLILGMGMASGGDTVLHSDPNAENTIIVQVVSDGCGATCKCTTRLDIIHNQEPKEGIYRVNDACDVEIKWLDQYRFEVIDKSSRSDEPVILDSRDFFK
jgi:hypothetical protein